MTGGEKKEKREEALRTEAGKKGVRVCYRKKRKGKNPLYLLQEIKKKKKREEGKEGVFARSADRRRKRSGVLLRKKRKEGKGMNSLLAKRGEKKRKRT